MGKVQFLFSRKFLLELKKIVSGSKAGHCAIILLRFEIFLTFS